MRALTAKCKLAQILAANKQRRQEKTNAQQKQNEIKKKAFVEKLNVQKQLLKQRAQRTKDIVEKKAIQAQELKEVQHQQMLNTMFPGKTRIEQNLLYDVYRMNQAGQPFYSDKAEK